MSDDLDPLHYESPDARPPSHGRILVIMAVIGVLGAVAGAAYDSAGFATGVLIGTALAFLNYVWLQRLLKTIFAAAANGERPRMLAGKYFLRYIVLAAAIAVIYMAGWVPVTALILGMAVFGFATVVEGFIRIFSSIFSTKEI